MRKDYDLVGSYDNQRISTISAARTVNMFEYLDPDGKRPKSLLSTSGLIDSELNFGAEMGGARQTFVFQNAIYNVYGTSVFRTTGSSTALVTSKIGTINTSTGYVGIDANTYQVIFVDGIEGWIWDTNASTFTKITDTGFPSNPIDVCYLDGFFLVANGNTNNFQLSEFNQGMVWSGGSSVYTASTITSILTLTTNGDNFATGVPVTLTSSQGSATFTANSGTDILTLSVSNENFQTGAAIKFTTTGTLPAPLLTATTYYSIMVGTPITDPGTIKVALTYADAIANVPIDLTTNGTPTNTVTSQGALPTPLELDTVYYSILLTSPATNPAQIQLASSYADAIAGTFIPITVAGSPINTVTVTGELQIGSITSHPGTIVACQTLHRRIFLFSQNYTEVWENAGLGTNLPFRRTNSLLIEVGTPAVGSVALGFDRMFFLSQDKDGLAGVMEVQGSNAIPVSNRALDYQLAQYAADPTTGVADARGILVKDNGLIFYRLNFTLANHTFVLNVSMSTTDAPKWHEEEVLNGNRHPAQTHAYFDGINYYGSYNAPLFYILSNQTSTNDGEAIRRMRIGRQMSPEGYNRLRIDRFQIDVLQGANDVSEFEDDPLLTENNLMITTEAGEDIIEENQTQVVGPQPIVFLSISKDGGQTYGNELRALMGAIGQRTYRTVWRKLGTTPRGQGFVPKIEFFNDTPFIILGAAWDFEVLPE